MSPRRPRGGGLAPNGRLAAALLLAVLAALAPAPAAACAIRHCAKCRALPKWRPGRGGVGLQVQCLRPKPGYQMATDGRSVPNCAAGYVARRKGGSCRPCDVDTFAPSRPIGDKKWRECRPCPDNTQSNAFNTRCVALPGYYGSGTECSEDHYCAGGSQWRCLPGLSTDGNTAQTDCLYVKEGYYLQQGNPKPCPVGTFSGGARLKSLATSCSSCGEGLTTGGSGSTNCTLVKAGYYRNGTAAAPCPVNTYQPSQVSISVAPTNCTPCATGSNTNSLIAQAACGYLSPGYYYNTTLKAPDRCVAETFSNSTQLISNFTACYGCQSKAGTNAGWGPGYGTCGSAGSTFCRCITAGYNNTGNTTKPIATACPVNTFRPSPMDWSDGSSLDPCNNCTANLNTNGTTGQAACNFVDAGYRYSNSTATATACAADTYAPLRNISDAQSCISCVEGATTNKTTAQKSCDYLLPGYRYSTTTTPKKPVACTNPWISNTTRLISDPTSTVCPYNCTIEGLKPNANNTACVANATTDSLPVLEADSPTGGGGGAPLYEAPDGEVQGYAPVAPPQDGEPLADEWAVAPGYFWDFSAAGPSPCPPDSRAPESRQHYTAGSCEPCPPGLGTNGAGGQAQCLWVLPGFWYSGGAAARCPPDTFSGALRAAAEAADCTPCHDGTSTNGADGQTECLAGPADAPVAQEEVQAQAPPATYSAPRVRTPAVPQYAYMRLGG